MGEEPINNLKTRWPIAAIISLGIIISYSVSWPVVPIDGRLFLIPWYDHLAQRGIIEGLSVPFSNYTPPYLYLLAITTIFDGIAPAIMLIKSLSLFGSVLLAFAFRNLLSVLDVELRIEAALWLLLIPSLLVNVSVLGQADAFWVSACVVAVAEALRGRLLRMVIWSGIALSFKLQAAFIAPFVMAVLIRQRAPIWYWAVPGLTFVAAMVPAWLLGWPALRIARIYVFQAQWGQYLDGSGGYVGNASNPWSIARIVDQQWAWNHTWIGYVAAAIGVVTYIIWVSRRALSPADLLAAACLSATLFPWLLPKMHERFFLLADVLAFALAWTLRSSRGTLIAALVLIASTLAVYGYLIERPLGAIGCNLVLAAILLIAQQLRRTQAHTAGTARPNHGSSVSGRATTGL